MTNPNINNNINNK